jgi:hypothetical protein
MEQDDMKLHRYWMTSAPWWIIDGGLKPMDINLILYRAGKALGIVRV